MISLGFVDQLHQICGQLRPDRQTLLFSATLSERLETAAGSWLQSPVRIYADAVSQQPDGTGLPHRAIAAEPARTTHPNPVAAPTRGPTAGREGHERTLHFDAHTNDRSARR